MNKKADNKDLIVLDEGQEQSEQTEKKESKKQSDEKVNAQMGDYTQEPEINFDEPKIETHTETTKKRRRRRTTKKQSEDTRFFRQDDEGHTVITGKTLLFLVDITIPKIISIVNNKVTGEQLDPELLRMKDKDMQKLEALADETAELIKVKANPALLLTAAIGSIYLGNFLEYKAGQ